MVKKADISVIGPVDGMNERHSEGSYFRFVIDPRGEDREQRLLSRGAAEMLRDELNVVLGPPRQQNNPNELMISAMMVQVERGRGSGSLADFMRRIWLAGEKAR